MALSKGTYTPIDTIDDSETLSTGSWAATTAYTVGTYIDPAGTNYIFVVTTGGTSGGSQPTWPTGRMAQVIGQTVVDGTVTWKCVGDPVIFFQDLPVSPESLADGTLRLRFDTKAYPQKGITYSGTDSDGNTVPPTPKTVY